LQNPIAQSHENEAITYLKHGTQLIVIPGLAVDLLSGKGDIIGPPNVFTDGKWAWTGDVPFYVNRYHITLPDGLLKRMESFNWRCPSVPNPQELQLDNWEPTEETS
jgi:hypothetical protein